MPTYLQTLAVQAVHLSPKERLELIAILEALNQAEQDLIPPSAQSNSSQANSSATQLQRKVAALQRVGIRGGKGSFEDKYIRGYGPYRYLRYWYGKTHKSIYLGKVSSHLEKQLKPEIEP
ncbi:MAG: hypothetical protein MUF72_12400 [Elainella sp. Prado103]|jgi:hypothetical protein|nr:hypothetical protein [Elainella sp. Prado103]